MTDIVFTDKLLDYKEFRRYGDTFIETGSAAGDGIQRCIYAGFKEIHSIEAAQSWYDLCVDRFKTNPMVWMHLGKSTDVLKELLPNLDAPDPVFFLDAHPSGPLSAGHDDVVKNGPESEFSQDNVIKAELKIILANFKGAVIIIDDQNGLDDYSQEYINILLEAYPSYIIEFYDEDLDGQHFYKNKLLVARHG